MATSATKPAKKLREVLQEQQEPFLLDIYLTERGYLKKSLSSNAGLSCGHARSSTLNKSRRGIPHHSKVFKTVSGKLISISESLKIKNSGNRKGKVGGVCVTEMPRNDPEVTAEAHRISFASSTTVFNSCSESNAEETSNSLHVEFNAEKRSFKHCDQSGKELTGCLRKFQWRCKESSKQLGPVSALEEIPTRGRSPLHNKKHGFGRKQEENSTETSVVFSRQVTENSVLSTSLWKLLFHAATTEKPKHAVVKSYPPSQHLKSKRILNQSKQLLFDCVREMIATQGRTGMKQQHSKNFLRSEEFAKLISEKVNAWGNQPVDESNIMQPLDLNILDSELEWSDFEQQKREIGVEIGDAILEEIRKEIVIDMNNFGTARC
ncbi:DUF4378 domain-containing protein [Cephalotus follicularis]|uniref:DUF4378 domain-containing protein n=1 Tax=Cephalotus follicularis TaxID=3775 RepID=A0A1Q3ALK9_CEPFO|nr:DUF4378 domain-containing protein [Cephalotus follicularis]